MSNRSISHRSLLGILAAGALLLAATARANDGGIAFGGSPGLLKGHPSVSMASEVVRMAIGEEKATVDCRFVFRNDGPACSVRMGFPDRGEGAMDPDEENENPMRTPPKSTFLSFKSWVDSAPVKTELIRADKPGRFWHAKTVEFPANGQRAVRDLYTLPVGAQITVHNSNLAQMYYILHTGASWHGPIGRSEVLVTFNRRRMAAPLHPVRLSSVPKHDPYDWSPSHWQPGTVVYQGPAAPAVSGKTLRFVRTNWRPAEGDDVQVYFDNRRL
jgi:hypothetical protein